MYLQEAVFSESSCQSKVEYIHMNPVRAGILKKEEEHLLSSCGDLYGVRKGVIDLDQL
ncbi:MAG: hypothetical protein AAF789_01740 [Bacteroidota bacterium]